MMQKHGPCGLKHCLTVVPKDEEIPSLEKIMKEKCQKRINYSALLTEERNHISMSMLNRSEKKKLRRRERKMG